MCVPTNHTVFEAGHLDVNLPCSTRGRPPDGTRYLDDNMTASYTHEDAGVGVGWHEDARQRLPYTAWHLAGNTAASRPYEDFSVSFPFVTIGTTQLARLIEKSHALHMWGLERALMVSGTRHGAVHMYSLQQVQLLSRPWDRGKSEPGQSLSTDTGNICALLWTYLSSVIYTTGLCGLIWSKNSVTYTAKISGLEICGPKKLDFVV